MASYDVGKKMDELILMEGLEDHELGIGSRQEHLRHVFVPFVGAREGRSTLKHLAYTRPIFSMLLNLFSGIVPKIDQFPMLKSAIGLEGLQL